MSRPSNVTGSSGSTADSRHAEGERDVLLELGLDQRLVVGEVEHALAVGWVPLVVGVHGRRRPARRHLRREAERAERLVHVHFRLAVDHVELGADVGVVPGHCRALVVADHRLGDHVVGRGGGDLPADSVEQQLGRAVVVDEELRGGPLEQCDEGLRLGFGRRGRAVVRVARRVGGGALLVVAPARREVAVEVDAVAGRDDAVAIVVAQVLAPQPVVAVREREVVAVRVGDRDEPHLRRVHEGRDVRVRAVAGEDVVEEAADHLGRDPLACALRGDEDGRRTPSVPDRRRILRHPNGDDLLALRRMADDPTLGDRRVRRRLRLHLLVDPSRAAVRTEHAVRGVRGDGPGGRSLVGDDQDAAGRGDGVRLAGAEDHLDRDLAGAPTARRHHQLLPVDAERVQRGQARGVEDAAVHAVVVVRPWRYRRRAARLPRHRRQRE